MRTVRTALLALFVLMSALPVHADPPDVDLAHLPMYVQALEQSKDPQAVAIRREVASGPADLAKERTAALAAGVPLDAASLQRPLPPPDQNAALLYQQLDALRHSRPLNLPTYAQPLRFGFAYSPAQIASVQAIYEGRRDVLDLLHQAAGKPQCVFQKDWSSGPAVLFPELAGMREDARELETESFLLARQGKYSDAITNQALGFRVAQQAASDPTLINYLVGVAIDAITLAGMRNILYEAGPNADVDSAVRQAITTNAPALSLKYALAGETVISLTIIDQLRKADPSQLAEAFTPNASTKVEVQPLTPDQSQFVSNLLSAWGARYLSEMLPLISAADSPGAARRAVFTAQAASGPANDPVSTLDSIVMPNFSGSSDKADLLVAQAQVTMAAAAILAAKAKTGVFPAVLPSDFPDPFSGKPLGYRREGTGFVVYSVGPGGTFDGGHVGDKPPANQATFGYPAPEPIPVQPDAQN